MKRLPCIDCTRSLLNGGPIPSTKITNESQIKCILMCMRSMERAQMQIAMLLLIKVKRSWIVCCFVFFIFWSERRRLSTWIRLSIHTYIWGMLNAFKVNAEMHHMIFASYRIDWSNSTVCIRKPIWCCSSFFPFNNNLELIFGYRNCCVTLSLFIIIAYWLHISFILSFSFTFFSFHVSFAPLIIITKCDRQWHASIKYIMSNISCGPDPIFFSSLFNECYRKNLPKKLNGFKPKGSRFIVLLLRDYAIHLLCINEINKYYQKHPAPTRHCYISIAIIWLLNIFGYLHTLLSRLLFPLLTWIRDNICSTTAKQNTFDHHNIFVLLLLLLIACTFIIHSLCHIHGRQIFIKCDRTIQFPISRGYSDGG